MKTSLQEIPLIGVDTGGTFTDLVWVCGNEVRTYKLPSTPADPARAVLEGIAALTDATCTIFHGSTVATNALLENKGAKIALVTTDGFDDILLIGRQNRPSLYALQPQQGRARLERSSVVGVRERVLSDGSVGTALTDAEVERAVERVRETGCSSVALCLIHAYVNPRHETRLAEALGRAGFQVSASHRILREYREFERASTTAVNAMVSPVMERYLKLLHQGLGGSPLKIMQSNGGSISSHVAGVEGVRTILSGPAGGMVGAFRHAKDGGYDRIITFDMGGTSTDVGLCAGEIPVTTETTIAGWPVKVPMIDIHTVGAGGGSIARIDAGGALRVGPQSAGADPGPVCYGRGDQVTVTDANLYLGRLIPDRFLGGRMSLHVDRARRAVENLAAEASLPVARLAEGIIEVAEATMVGALRVVSVQKGYDPRDFVLLPFGGAGGLHACALAEKLGIDRVLLPVHPGLLSAVGMVRSDSIRDYSVSILHAGALRGDELERLLRPLKDKAREEMRAEGHAIAAIRFETFLDMRYVGQSFELTVPLDGNYEDLFHELHEQRYGYRDEDRQVEIVTLRLRAIAKGPEPCFHLSTRTDGMVEPVAHQDVIYKGASREAPLYERDSLPEGQQVRGPALIVEETATHWLAPGWRAEVDSLGHLLLERDNES